MNNRFVDCPRMAMLLSLFITWIEKRLQLMRTISGVVAWLLALAIVILSLMPAPELPSTGASRGIEHTVIFLACGMAFGFAFTHRLPILPFLLTIFAGTVEFSQLIAPGRHARLSDFMLDAAAACAGAGLSWVGLRLSRAAINKFPDLIQLG